MQFYDAMNKVSEFVSTGNSGGADLGLNSLFDSLENKNKIKIKK